MPANLQGTNDMGYLLAQPGAHGAATLPNSPHVGLLQPMPRLLPEGCLSPRPCPAPESLIKVLFQRSPALMSIYQCQAQMATGAP